ncbi:hypothetical protein [Candidatus Laterigemmans baculatus]|uniref:hypothetical protein n=1 Tax=Candidatus Laterigemmans baculatus TaxID=2770505 RepID=UPI0013DBBAA1|nr:hypothetical protein [Candidatus Laterigemmans baculatus]
MNLSRSLQWAWTPWTLLFSVLALAIAAVLSWLAWKRSGYRRSILGLELVRLALLATAALLLNGPEWIEEYRPASKPTVVVLWDDSPSMETRDVVAETSGGASGAGGGSGTAAGPPLSRREALAPLTDSAAWQTLDEDADVVVQRIAASGQGTDLSEPLSKVAEAHENLIGVVLASDGDWNAGAPPVGAASRLRARGVPVFAIPVGSTTRLPDLELVSFDVPTFAVQGKSVRIPFTIDSSLPRDYATTVTLRSPGGKAVEKQIRIAAMGRTSEAIVWEPGELGEATLTLEVPSHAEEILSDNNRVTAPISVREEKLRVLIVESYPRWEYRYLRNALSRDPGVEVSCLLFHPGLSRVGGGSIDYIQRFPEGKDELAEYDVVFLGDVGIDDEQLTVEQCSLVKGLVEHQASGLVFLPGWQGRQFSLLETELQDLYPVVLDETQPGGWGSRTPQQFELTESGRRSLLTKLADTHDENVAVWESLPGFQWYAPVRRAKAGTEVLSVHREVSNQYGRLPLLVTRKFGAGKVLFMGTDGAWRWRKGVEDLYHYRFWGQVVRWMAYQRNMAAGESMRLYYSPEQPQVRQTITFNANVMDSSGEPLAAGDVTARVVAPSGAAETIRFHHTGEAWGAFAGRYTAEEPGNHAVTLHCQQTQASLEATLFVQGAPLEQVGKPARPEVLEEITRVTRGKVVALDKVEEVARSLAALPAPPASVRRVQLWSHPAVAGVIIALLGLFWVGRKIVGLV